MPEGTIRESSPGCYHVVYFIEISAVFCIMQIESGHQPVCAFLTLSHRAIINVTSECSDVGAHQRNQQSL